MVRQINNKKINESLVLLSSTKMHLFIIWIEGIPLLQVYFSHFIAKQGIKQGNRFCSVCFSISVIYYGPANWSCRRQIPCVNYFIIIIFYEVFLCFFLSQFFQKNVFSFCVLVLENQEAFSESCSFISGVLQGLGKICKKYMEVNHFLLLICNLEK